MVAPGGFSPSHKLSGQVGAHDAELFLREFGIFHAIFTKRRRREFSLDTKSPVAGLLLLAFSGSSLTVGAAWHRSCSSVTTSRSVVAS